MNYYYADTSNEPVGPLSLEQLHALAREGTIGPDTHVLAEGSNEWQNFRSLFPPLPPTRTLVPVGRNSPIIEVSPSAVPSQPLTKECPFCSEPVAITAKKCKHCGEILDVTLRAAEEAKRASARQPMVFMNAGGGASSSSSSSAAAAATGGKKRGSGCLGCFVLAVLGFIVLAIIGANADKTATTGVPRPTPTPIPRATRP